MSYRYDKKQKNKKRKIIMFSIFILVLVFTPLLNGLYTLLESPIQQAYNNAEKGKKHLGLLLDTARFSKTNLVEHNRLLQEQVQKLSIENERIHFLEKQVLNISGDHSLTYAHIIDRSFLQQSIITLDKGSRDGVETGDLIFVADVLIGEVQEVFDITSRVMLYTNREMMQSAILFPRDLSITLQGYGGLDYYFEIDRLVEVQEGDIVYSESYPGYIMAIVRNVDFDPREPFKKVLLSPAMNINNVTDVQIMKKNTN